MMYKEEANLNWNLEIFIWFLIMRETGVPGEKPSGQDECQQQTLLTLYCPRGLPLMSKIVWCWTE